MVYEVNYVNFWRISSILHTQWELFVCLQQIPENITAGWCKSKEDRNY